MNILFTGASSFTGYWFVKHLAAAGHKVVCPVTGGLERYAGVRQWRVEQLRPLCRFVPEAPFGSEAFLALTCEGPWDLLCHHGAEVTDYRSPQFDAFQALHKNTRNLQPVLNALRERGLKGMVLTGSMFENDEGAGDEPLRAFSPYGLSKGLTYQAFRYYCDQARVGLTKFVIPNPFGPYEEDRFTGYLARSWKAGKVAVVKTPAYVRDNIPVDLLARVYVKTAEMAATPATRESGGLSVAGCAKVNPSGYVESQGTFAQRVAREVQGRTDWSCRLELARQTDFTEPPIRLNQQPAMQLVANWDERAFWDAFVEFYR